MVDKGYRWYSVFSSLSHTAREKMLRTSSLNDERSQREIARRGSSSTFFRFYTIVFRAVSSRTPSLRQFTFLKTAKIVSLEWNTPSAAARSLSCMGPTFSWTRPAFSCIGRRLSCNRRRLSCAQPTFSYGRRTFSCIGPTFSCTQRRLSCIRRRLSCMCQRNFFTSERENPFLESLVELFEALREVPERENWDPERSREGYETVAPVSETLGDGIKRVRHHHEELDRFHEILFYVSVTFGFLVETVGNVKERMPQVF